MRICFVMGGKNNFIILYFFDSANEIDSNNQKFFQNIIALMSLIMTLSDGISIGRNIMILVMAQIKKE